MGTTDRPDLQLSLKKGETITVIGDVDVEDYFTAIINGMIFDYLVGIRCIFYVFQTFLAFK